MNEQGVSLEKAFDLLQELGLDVSAIDSNHWEIQGKSVQVVTRHTTPSPAAVSLRSLKDMVWVIPSLTPGLRALAQAHRSLAFVSNLSGEVWLAGVRVQGEQVQVAVGRKRGRIGWAKYGLMRALAISSRPRTQVELANALGVTQARVSTALQELQPLVRKTKNGWVATDFESMAQSFLSSYPGPGGIRLGWFSSNPILEQGKSVIAIDKKAVLSADSAADVLAPIRTPKLTLAYVQRNLPLAQRKFAESPVDRATLIEVLPEDRTIFSLANAFGSSQIADGLLAAYDLQTLKREDSDQAVSHLLHELKQRWSASE